MDMDMDEDDPMEIDDSIPAARIIERKSDEYTPSAEPIDSAQKSSAGVIDPLSDNKKQKTEGADIVVLDDDDEEPRKGK